MNQLKKHLIRLHYILGYPFFDAHGKAFARWYVSDSEEKRYQYDDLTEKSLVFDGGGYCGDFSARIFEKYHCTCFIFEPVTELMITVKLKYMILVCPAGQKQKRCPYQQMGAVPV